MNLKTVLVVALGWLLAACGADGEPTRPEPKQTASSGVRVSGTARVGVSVSRGIVTPYAPGVSGPGAVSGPSGF